MGICGRLVGQARALRLCFARRHHATRLGQLRAHVRRHALHACALHRAQRVDHRLEHLRKKAWVQG